MCFKRTIFFSNHPHNTSTSVLIASDLTTISDRLCVLWTSTRDNILRKSNFPCKQRYGLKFDIQHKKSHLVFLILLAGDIATNPGPTMATQSGHLPDIQSTREKVDGKFLTKCLVVNARSLLSVHKKDGKQTCHLSNFQDLIYSEEADLVWVTETWLRDDIESSEILPWGYTIYRKDRKSRAGGVLLAVKSCSFSTSREINFDTDLELVTVELTSKSNSKYLLCCCYKSQQNVNSQWLGKFNIFLNNSCSQYSNMLVCGDFNFPKISWKSLELTTGVDEVQFTEQLYDYHLTQLNTFPTRGNNVLDLVITNVPSQVENVSVITSAESGLITDHSTIVFNLKTSVKAAPKLKRRVFDYKRGNFDELRAALEALDLCSVIESEVNV